MVTALKPARLTLASNSPRRRELLTQIGIDFDLLGFRGPPRADQAIDETPLPFENPADYALRVALAKTKHGVLMARLRRLPEQVVLAADTTLELDGEIIGKPENAHDAKSILQQLSGRAHRVITAVALCDQEKTESMLSISEVRFHPISADDIDAYVATGEPLDKAGAYGIQGRAALFVEHLCGSYSGVMGLPLFETGVLLRRFGLR